MADQTDTIIENLESNLAVFSKLYDIMRLVDPLKKKVLVYRGELREETESICYQYWNTGKICDNCISLRAHADNKCYQKLEQGSGTIMMVTALPLETTAGPTVLELLKNATDTMLIGSGVYHDDGRLMKSMVMELNDLVIKDEQTGLYNRRFVNERLAADIIRSTLEAQPLSILFVDMDNLKEINDRFGHAVGDRRIGEIAEIFGHCIRGKSDWVARYGGDEFLVCLNNTSSEAAYQVAERLRSKVSELILAEDPSIASTVSLGIHTMHGTPITPDELIALADRRMYAAKRRGKNRIIAVEADLPEEAL